MKLPVFEVPEFSGSESLCEAGEAVLNNSDVPAAIIHDCIDRSLLVDARDSTQTEVIKKRLAASDFFRQIGALNKIVESHLAQLRLGKRYTLGAEGFQLSTTRRGGIVPHIDTFGSRGSDRALLFGSLRIDNSESERTFSVRPYGGRDTLTPLLGARHGIHRRYDMRIQNSDDSAMYLGCKQAPGTMIIAASHPNPAPHYVEGDHSTVAAIFDYTIVRK